MTWKKLPIENLILKEMTIFGNGKDCELRIITKNPKKTIFFEMREPRLNVDIQAKIITKSFNDGDSDLGIKYIPSEEIKITVAKIYFPGEEEEWIHFLDEFGKGDLYSFGWMISNLKITLKNNLVQKASTH